MQSLAEQFWYLIFIYLLKTAASFWRALPNKEAADALYKPCFLVGHFVIFVNSHKKRKRTMYKMKIVNCVFYVFIIIANVALMSITINKFFLNLCGIFMLLIYKYHKSHSKLGKCILSMHYHLNKFCPVFYKKPPTTNKNQPQKKYFL